MLILELFRNASVNEQKLNVLKNLETLVHSRLLTNMDIKGACQIEDGTVLNAGLAKGFEAVL